MSIGGDGKFAFTGRIVSHEGRSLDAWVDFVGFEPDQLLYNKYQGKLDQRLSYNDISLGKWCASDGMMYKDAIIKHDKNDDGKDLSFGQNINFTVCPPCYQPQAYLT